MQDKEFDQLFNSKLGDFEVEPSPIVWQNIAREMEGKKAKRSMVPYLSIAASVIIVASVSLLFYNKTAEKPDQPIKLVKIKPVKPLSGADTNNQPVVIDRIEDDTYLKEAAVAIVEKRKTAQASKTPQVAQVKQTIIVTPSNPIAQNPEPILSIVPAENKTLPIAVPANDIIVSTGSLADRPVETIARPIEAVVNTPEIEKSPAKKRAGGLGGFINTIVAAVDKREDKLIEFTDADNDEGSRVTGVNLGFIKIKKQ